MAETRLAETDERSGMDLLRNFCEDGFGGDTSEAGLVLGRTQEEIDAMLRGDMVVDDDLILKIRGIADERSIQL